jgi:hypothetical protein
MPYQRSGVLCVAIVAVLFGTVPGSSEARREARRSAGPTAWDGAVRDEAGSGVAQQAADRRMQTAHGQALALAKAWALVPTLPVTTAWSVPPAYLERVRQPASPMRRPGAYAPNVWFPVGPQPIAADPPGVWGVKNAHETGRLIAIAATTQGPIYAGGEFGGLWEYTRATRRWRALTDDQPSPQVGAIAIDPAAPGTVYAGTGANDSLAICRMGMMGQGLLRSTAEGKWELVGSEALAGLGIARIAAGAGPDRAVLLATSGGVFRSSDGGTSWNRTSTECAMDLAVSPASASTVYATTKAGLIRSSDGGVTWDTAGVTQLPLPMGFTIDHFLIGVSRGGARADVLYASVTSGGCRAWAAFRSPDAGRTWASLGAPSNMGNGFCLIGQAHSLAVDPRDANLAVLGGGWLYVYNASSQAWTKVGVGAAEHGDQRALAFDADGHLYVGNDGGAWEVPDVTRIAAGVSLNDGGLQVTEFEHGASVSPDGTVLMAGSQDNGTSVYDGALTWAGPLGADGASTAIDQNDASHQFAEQAFEGHLIEKTSSGNWHGLALPQGCRAGSLAISPALPSRTPAPTALWVGGGNVLCEYAAASPGGAMAWSTHPQACPVPGPAKCQTSVSTVRVDALEPGHVFAGWANGAITFSTDSGKTWKTATSQPIAGGIATLAVSPTDPYALAATTPSGRVWVGAKIDTPSPVWSDVTGNLPVVQGLGRPVVLYSAQGIIVGTGLGVFERPATAQGTWAVVGRGLPMSRLTDLQWRRGDLVVFTYGRGAWEIVSPAGGK